MVPNSVLLQLAVEPLREPERVDLRARFDAGVSPARIQQRLEQAITVPFAIRPTSRWRRSTATTSCCGSSATPERPSDGAKLAEEILSIARGRDGDAGGRRGRLR